MKMIINFNFTVSDADAENIMSALRDQISAMLVSKIDILAEPGSVISKAAKTRCIDNHIKHQEALIETVKAGMSTVGGSL